MKCAAVLIVCCATATLANELTPSQAAAILASVRAEADEDLAICDRLAAAVAERLSRQAVVLDEATLDRLADKVAARIGQCPVPAAWDSSPARPPAAAVEPAPATRQVPAAANIWRADYDDARAEARRRNRPLLLYFTQPNCAPCAKVEQLQAVPNIAKWIQNGFVGVRLDGRQHGAKFGVTKTPTHLVLWEDAELTRWSGAPSSAAQYARLLDAAYRAAGQRKDE